MTVSELIEQLKKYPPDMRVLVLGYEAGYNEASLTTEAVIFNANDKDHWYYGAHESASLLGASNGTECLIVSREINKEIK